MDKSLLEDWNARLDRAESMLPIIGRLYRKNGIVTKVFGRLLVNSSPVDIIKTHRFARRVTGEALSVNDTGAILEGLAQLSPPGVLRLDVGKLAVQFRASGGTDVLAFLKQELASVEPQRLPLLERPQDVVLYGFGRIGRLVARMLLDKLSMGHGLRLAAIVVRPGKKDDLSKRASLLRRDSVHGPFQGTISIDRERNQILANGAAIQVIYARNPEDIDYTEYGIDNAVIIDNTGVWRDEAGLGRHLQAKGAAKVVLTAPGKGDIPNIVYGINHDSVTDDQSILSAASCTTNAIVPVLKLINDRFGIDHGHIETCHAYTNDQNLIDNFHDKPRRGRGAPLNMVITETGAAKAVAKALPELAGKLTGSAIRVPTPNVSLAVMQLHLSAETTVEELNEHLRLESLDGEQQLQVEFSMSPDAVSSDFVGFDHAAIVDAPATIVTGKHAVVYVWYDNEYGYSRQVVRLVERVSGVRPPTFPR
jgi:glyceraldehyde 3-phosphate dehydrogenase (phosphorylating)